MTGSVSFSLRSLFPITRQPMPMRHRSNQDAVATNEIGDVVWKHRAIHPTVSPGPFSPHERMSSYEAADIPNLTPESLTQAWVPALVIPHRFSKLGTSLRKKIQSHSVRSRSISEKTSDTGMLSCSPESYRAIRSRISRSQALSVADDRSGSILLRILATSVSR